MGSDSSAGTEDGSTCAHNPACGSKAATAWSSSATSSGPASLVAFQMARISSSVILPAMRSVRAWTCLAQWSIPVRAAWTTSSAASVASRQALAAGAAVAVAARVDAPGPVGSAVADGAATCSDVSDSTGAVSSPHTAMATPPKPSATSNPSANGGKERRELRCRAFGLANSAPFGGHGGP
jgi:hypothetical protein